MRFCTRCNTWAARIVESYRAKAGRRRIPTTIHRCKCSACSAIWHEARGLAISKKEIRR